MANSKEMMGQCGNCKGDRSNSKYFDCCGRFKSANQPQNQECKYCYGKGFYSRFKAGGTFGDSFDGYVYIKPEIEYHPCRCQKPTEVEIKEKAEYEFDGKVLETIKNAYPESTPSPLDFDKVDKEWFNNLSYRPENIEGWHHYDCRFPYEDQANCNCGILRLLLLRKIAQKSRQEALKEAMKELEDMNSFWAIECRLEKLLKTKPE